MRLSICVLYPDRLNLYADRGNLTVLQRRCQWRGIDVEIHEVVVGGDAPHDRHDLYYLSGGQDRDQVRCATELQRHAEMLRAAASSAVVLGICGGYQLLGHHYRVDDRTLQGIGLLDVTSEAGDDRLVGPIEATAVGAAGDERLVGFENHRGRTSLGDSAQPLALVSTGHGNNGVDRTEGAQQGTVFGTYLHGPVLARNVWLADRLIALATGEHELAPLDDWPENLVRGISGSAGSAGSAASADRGPRAALPGPSAPWTGGDRRR